jgi:microcystin-dependent protein
MDSIHPIEPVLLTSKNQTTMEELVEAYMGEIRMFCGSQIPSGWLLCDGSPMVIAQNVTLFSILGTAYGGNGQTTFALPDLRGRVPVQFGENEGCGFQDGSPTKTVMPNNMPEHTHDVDSTIAVNANIGNTNSPIGAFPGNSNVRDSEYSGTSDDSLMASDGLNVIVNPTGAGQPVSNIQPMLTVNFIICTNGLVPNRW